MGKARFGLAVVVLGALVSLAVLGCSMTEEAEEEPTPTSPNEEAEQELTLTGPDVIQIGWQHEPPLRNSARRIVEGQKVDSECRYPSNSIQGSKIVRTLAVDEGNCLKLMEEGTLSAEGRRFRIAERATVEAYMEKHPELYSSGSMDAEEADRTPASDGDRSK